MNNTSATFTSAAGGYIIFDITDPAFLAGKIPGKFCEEANANGPWFYQPSQWSKDNGWESTVARLMKFPMMYSPGFATAEAALVDANEWEGNTETRVHGQLATQAMIAQAFGEPAEVML